MRVTEAYYVYFFSLAVSFTAESKKMLPKTENYFACSVFNVETSFNTLQKFSLWYLKKNVKRIFDVKEGFCLIFYPNLFF